MAANVWELPPVATSDDPVDCREEDLLAIMPKNRKRPYSRIRLYSFKSEQFPVSDCRIVA